MAEDMDTALRPASESGAYEPQDMPMISYASSIAATALQTVGVAQGIRLSLTALFATLTGTPDAAPGLADITTFLVQAGSIIVLSKLERNVNRPDAPRDAERRVPEQYHTVAYPPRFQRADRSMRGDAGEYLRRYEAALRASGRLAPYQTGPIEFLAHKPRPWDHHYLGPPFQLNHAVHNLGEVAFLLDTYASQHPDILEPCALCRAPMTGLHEIQGQGWGSARAVLMTDAVIKGDGIILDNMAHMKCYKDYADSSPVRRAQMFPARTVRHASAILRM